MSKSFKKLVGILLTVAMISLCAACGKSSGGADTSNTSEPVGETQTDSAAATEPEPAAEPSASGEKQDLVLIITQQTDFDKSLEEKINAEFGEKYNVILKTWEESNVEQTVKTAATAGEQVDLVKFWPMQMESFLSVDLATDLTPYMDDAWKDRFTNVSILEMGTYNGNLYNIPYDNVYPAIVANTAITDAAGITLPENGAWTWAEFEEACKTIEDKTDAFGVAVQKEQACWLVRNLFLQVWNNADDMNKFIKGEVSIKDPKVVDGLNMIKKDFEDGLFYPGEGALAVTQDQLYAGFSQGKFAFMFLPTSNAVGALERTGITTFKIMDYPSMGGANPPLLGGCNGWFIPKNAKNVDGAIEVMKYLQSEELSTYKLDAGKLVVTKASADSKVDKDLLAALTRNANSIQPKEIMGLDAELNEYIMQLMPANYFNNGTSALDELDALREAALNK